ncbi:MAG: aldose 1-epimerase [Acidimicrobiia bacterium]|nr:aldose 1-epimerase [Acidimicrobiia bacterium]
MPDEPRVHVDDSHGAPGVTLSAGRLAASFLPSVGMLGVSLRRDGLEYVALPDGVAGFRSGHTTGIPLLHPWANRLAKGEYRVERARVDLAGLDVHRDGKGLPMHGTMVGPLRWSVVRAGPTGRRAVLSTTFDHGRDDTARFRAFPFPHRLTITASLGADALEITTTVEPTGRRAVPISFGFHPYFTLPGVARRDWSVELPSCTQIDLDDRGIPTGQTSQVRGGDVALEGRTFDDHYRLHRERRLAISGGGRRLEVRIGRGYEFTQVYAPPRHAFTALEPMTAATNALVTGDHPTVSPGDRYRATFTVLPS